MSCQKVQDAQTTHRIFRLNSSCHAVLHSHRQESVKSVQSGAQALSKQQMIWRSHE